MITYTYTKEDQKKIDRALFYLYEYDEVLLIQLARFDVKERLKRFKGDKLHNMLLKNLVTLKANMIPTGLVNLHDEQIKPFSGK